MSTFGLDYDTDVLNHFGEPCSMVGAPMERRRWARFLAPGLPAELQVDGVIYHVALHDLSLMGALVTGPLADVPRGALVYLRVGLGEYGLLTVSGHVKWLDTTREEKGVGIQFSRLDMEARHRLVDYLLDLWA